MPASPNKATISTVCCIPLLALLFCLLAARSADAQTLSEGAVAFTGMEANNDYDFAFVAIHDIPAGEVIYFASDGGWSGGSVGSSGKRIQWTAPAGGLEPGDRVEFLNPKNNSDLGVSSGSASVPSGSNGDWVIQKEGIYAYQGTSIGTSSPTILAFLATSRGSSHAFPSIEGQSLDLSDSEGDDAGWDDGLTTFASPAAMLVALSEYNSTTSQYWDDNNNFNTSSFTVSGIDVLHETFQNDLGFTKSNQTSFYGGSDDDYYGIWDEYGDDDDFDGESTPPGGDIHGFDNFQGNCLIGEDMDADGTVPAYLDWVVDISGVEAGLFFQLSAAEQGMDNSPSNDYIRLYATLNPANYGSAVIDLDGSTLNGWSDKLKAQAGSGTYDGTTLYLRLETGCNGGNDRWAVDNVIVSGTEISCTDVTVSANAPTVDLGGSGTVTITAAESGGTITVSTTGDCFTVDSYEVSKNGASSGFSASVAFDCGETGQQDVWVRARNSDGSSVSAATATTVTIVDQSAPTFSTIDNSSPLDLDGSGAFTLTASSSYVTGAADNCSSQGLTFLVSATENGTYAATIALSCADVGNKTLWFKVKDASENLSSAISAVFEVRDVIAPTITALGTVNALADNNCEATSVSLGTPTTGDNCSVVSVTNDAPATFPLGTTVVTWTVTDPGGNTATDTQSVVVTDPFAPSAPVVGSASFQLSTGTVTVGVADLTLSSTDNCTAAGDLTYELSLDNSTWGTTVTFGCGNIGSSNDLYARATDASGNVSSAGLGTITITDATGLTAIGQDITVALDSDGNYALTASEVDNGSVGNCNTILSVSPNSFDCNSVGANEVTLTITDDNSGASNSTTVTVTVIDNLAPNVMALPSLTVSLGADGTATILPANVAVLGNPADRCTPNADLTFEIKRAGGTYGADVSVNCADLGVASFNVVVTAIDAAGNAWVSDNIPITVQDGVAPIIDEFASGISQTLDANGSAIIDATTYITSASDNCTASGSLTYEISETSGSGFAATFAADCDDVGDKTFYFRVVDASGNASSETTEVISILDNQAPTVTASDRVLILSGASVTLSASDVNFNASSDNCSLTAVVKLTASGDETYASSLDFTSTGSYGVTLKVTDGAGNSATDEATITVTAEPDEVTLYAEDFEDDVLQNGQGSYPSFCAQDITEADDGNWSLLCGDGLLTVYPDGASNNGFNWYSLNGSVTGDWLSKPIDVSSILSVSAVLNVSELDCGGCTTEGLTLYTILDGGAPIQQDTQTGDFGTGTLTISDLSTASSSTLVLKVSGMGMTGADLYLTDVNVTGTCIDLDGNGVCDDDQNCVDVPAGSCGCTDQTACTYSATATTNDPDSCQYVGYECQDPTATTGYTWTLSSGSCVCSSNPFETLYFEDFGAGGEAGGQGSNYGYSYGGDTDNSAGVGVDGWFLSFDNPNVGDGTTQGDEPNYFKTHYVLNNGSISTAWGSNVVDTSMWANFTETRVTWSSKLLTVGAYSDLHLSANVFGLQNNTSDYGGVRLGDNRIPFEWTSSTGSVSSFTAVTQSLALDVDTIRVRVDINANTSNSYFAFDDVVLSAWGKSGCTDSNASNYDATAQVDDGTCTGITFTTAYSRYDGGFSDKIWAGTACGGDCGTAPFLDARAVAALEQTNQTTFNYVVSSGTTVTVDGTQAGQDAGIEELFVRDLTIENGGALVIPSGKRLRVVGNFLDLDGAAISGGGEFCIDDSGSFLFCTAEVSGGQACPTQVSVPNLMIASGGELVIPEEGKVMVTGSLSFGATAPQKIEGLIVMSGTSAQTISGDGATVDRLQISNTAGVTVDGRLAVQGRLTLDAETSVDMGSDTLVFASIATSSGGIEKTGLLDAIPASASLEGPNGGPVKAQAQRYIGRDDAVTPQNGYFQFATPIENVTVGDIADTDQFYSAGWPGSDYPNWIQTILFWDESEGEFVAPTSNNTPLDTLGGAWVYLLSNQKPTFTATGALNGHGVSDEFDFSITRSPSTSGWNLVYNPYQGRLDWDAVVSASDAIDNESLIEDAVLVYDSQQQVFLRYTSDEANANIRTKNAYIEPGQSFYVRLKDTYEQSGAQTLTLSPTMLDNAAAGADFIRSSEGENPRLVLQTVNAFGTSHTVIHVDDEVQEKKNLSHLYSSQAKVGQLVVSEDGAEEVAHSLTLGEETKAMTVYAKAGVLTQLRVEEVVGQVEACMYIEDQWTGEVLVFEEGAALTFTPEVDVVEDRFFLHVVPQGITAANSPDCPGEEELGQIQVDLLGWTSDVTIVTSDGAQLLGAVGVDGQVEFDVISGEYTVIIETEEGHCREVRRQVVVFPGEQPELLGLEAVPAECNLGDAALAFEFYGYGEFQTSLWQGAETVWQDALGPGEHVLEDLTPGDYVLKVDHTCMEAVEMVSLSDPGMPAVSVLHDAFVEVEPIGGAWLNAECVGCLTGDGFGYYWVLDGEIVAEDMPLQERVNSVGQYELNLVAYGPDCEMSVPFEMLVGKHKIGSPDDVRWLGMVEGSLMAVFSEEWPGAQLRWYDSAGRLLEAEPMGALLGESFLPVPDAVGWLTLEVRSADGRVARWSGIR